MKDMTLENASDGARLLGEAAAGLVREAEMQGRDIAPLFGSFVGMLACLHERDVAQILLAFHDFLENEPPPRKN